MSAIDVAEPSWTGCTSPLFLFSKTTRNFACASLGGTRFCNHGKRIPHHPYIKECIGSPVNGRIFSFPEDNDRYCQGEYADANGDKSTCAFYHSFHRIVITTFGSRNTSSMPQQAMDALISKFKKRLTPIHLYDIVLFFSAPGKHVNRIWPFLDLLYELCLMLELRKCQFVSHGIDY